MLAVHSSDGIEQHVDIIRLRDASLVERVTESMRAADYDHLSIGSGTVAWAQDGQTIAFVAKEGPRDRILLWDLYDKELVQTLTMPDMDLVESLTWSPNSHQLAFIGTGQGQSDLYVIDVQTGERRQLTGTPEREDYPSWSPDGQRIAFSTKYRNQFDIKIYDLTKDVAHTAISSPTDDLWPQWLPEGNKLLFVSTPRQDQRSLRLSPRRGSRIPPDPQPQRHYESRPFARRTADCVQHLLQGPQLSLPDGHARMARGQAQTTHSY